MHSTGAPHPRPHIKGARYEIECDLPVIDNVDDIVVFLALNVGTAEKLMARVAILLIKNASQFSNPEVVIELAIIVIHPLRRL